MFKINFTGETKQTVVLLYEEFENWFIQYHAEDHEGGQVQKAFSSNINDLFQKITPSNRSRYEEVVVYFQTKICELYNNQELSGLSFIIDAIIDEFESYLICNQYN